MVARRADEKRSAGHDAPIIERRGLCAKTGAAPGEQMALDKTWGGGDRLRATVGRAPGGARRRGWRGRDGRCRNSVTAGSQGFPLADLT